MTPEQQIAAIRSALAAVESAIAQTENALLTAAPRDRPSLTAVLVDLRAERAKLSLQLANLEAAAIVVAPVAMRGARTASPVGPAPTAVVTDRAVVIATLTFAKSVRALAKSVRTAGTTPARSRSAKRPAAGPKRQAAAPAAPRRRR